MVKQISLADELPPHSTSHCNGYFKPRCQDEKLTCHVPAQAMRSAYGDSPEAGSVGVRLTLDTNVVMLKENPYSAMVSDRCFHLTPRTLQSPSASKPPAWGYSCHRTCLHERKPEQWPSAVASPSAVVSWSHLQRRQAKR